MSKITTRGHRQGEKAVVVSSTFTVCTLLWPKQPLLCAVFVFMWMSNYWPKQVSDSVITGYVIMTTLPSWTSYKNDVFDKIIFEILNVNHEILNCCFKYVHNEQTSFSYG